MRIERTTRIIRSTAALVALAALLVALGLALTGPARAASTKPTSSARVDDATVRFGDDVTVRAGETVQDVVTLGGDITVNGHVRDTVVAFGGDIVVRGSVDRNVVAFGGDVRLGSDADVGSALGRNESSVVLVGGKLTRQRGAQVNGPVEIAENADWSSFAEWATRTALVGEWWGFSFVGWLVETAIFLVLALVAAALMPSQMRATQRLLVRKPAPSFGWGALTMLVIVPGILIVLVVSVIGLLLVLPYALVALLFSFFVTTAVAAFIGGRVLAGTRYKDSLMLAVTLGVVGTTIVSRIPVAGPLAMCVMTLFGAGAAVMAFAEWRAAKKQVAPAGGPTPQAAPPATPYEQSAIPPTTPYATSGQLAAPSVTAVTGAAATQVAAPAGQEATSAVEPPAVEAPASPEAPPAPQAPPSEPQP